MGVVNIKSCSPSQTPIEIISFSRCFCNKIFSLTFQLRKCQKSSHWKQIKFESFRLRFDLLSNDFANKKFMKSNCETGKSKSAKNDNLRRPEMYFFFVDVNLLPYFSCLLTLKETPGKSIHFNDNLKPDK